jgi:hypothetical protein
VVGSGFVVWGYKGGSYWTNYPDFLKTVSVQSIGSRVNSTMPNTIKLTEITLKPVLIS